MSNCKLSTSQFAKVMKVVKTMTEVRSDNKQGRLAFLAVLILNVSAQVYEFSFENLRNTNYAGKIIKCEYSNSEIEFEYSYGMSIT